MSDMTKASTGKDRATGGSQEIALGTLNIKGTPSFLNTDRRAVRVQPYSAVQVLAELSSSHNHSNDASAVTSLTGDQLAFKSSQDH